jgi:aquaporin Z
MSAADMRFARPGEIARATRHPSGAVTKASVLHWREYLSEAACLGAFMCSAAVCATVLQHPASPLAIGGASALARVPMGLAMALTAIVLIYSPLGRRSGAHMNPAVTLTFWRLGKIASRDAVMYVLAQFAGGATGIFAATFALAPLAGHPSVNYIATVPGAAGPRIALLAEAAIAFGMMFVVLVVSNHARFHRFTGLCAGVLVCTYIVFEAPLSGMSMNAARSLGPAWLAGSLHTLWLYIVGPLAGMLLAAEAYIRLWGHETVLCAKLDHTSGAPCIFRCGVGTAAATHEVSEREMNEVTA